MREHLLAKLDRVVLIADDGKNYLAHKYRAYENKFGSVQAWYNGSFREGSVHIKWEG